PSRSDRSAIDLADPVPMRTMFARAVLVPNPARRARLEPRPSGALVSGLVLCLLALAPSAPAAASPEDPAFSLSIVGCEELDRQELLRMLELELVDVAPSFRERGTPPVELSC